MATFVNDLRLTELATGEGSGTWGTTTNTNLELIAEAFSFGTEAITTNADTHTTTIADGSTDPGRSIFLKYTGTLDSACTITIGPNTVSKLWLIENATSGSQSIIVSQGSGANITIPNGQTKAIYSDGAGSGAAMVDAFQDLSIPDLFIDDDLTIGDDLVFSSDSAVITFGADGDTTLTHTDGSGLTLNSTNKLMFNDASQFIQGSSATVLSLGATDEIDLTATAIDVNGTIDVSGNATLGGTLGVTGAVTANAGISIDNITIDGTEIDLSSGDLTIDVAGDIIFDADGGDFRFKDAGTQQFILDLDDSANSVILRSSTSDGDMIFQGNDGGSNITALTLDMSEAGNAIFNAAVTTGSTITVNSGSLNLASDGGTLFIGADIDMRLTHDGSNGTFRCDTGDMTFDVAGDIVLDADGGDFNFKDGGTTLLSLSNAGSNNVQLSTSISDGDLLIKGNDGGSIITALSFDMSAAGAATFNSSVTSQAIIATNASGVPSQINGAANNNTLQIFADTTSNQSFGLLVDAGTSSSDYAAEFRKADNTTIMRIRGDGNVGVGTDSPSARATIKTASNEEDAILIEQSDGTDVGSIRINNGSFIIKGKSSTAPVQLQTHDGNEDIEVDPDGFIKFETAGNERFRIDSNGVLVSGGNTAVGIGGTPGDANFVEIGPGYINLARDDTADADQILFGKNGAVHSRLETTSSTLNIQPVENINITINEDSVNSDFRAESNNNANMIFLDAANDRVMFAGSAQDAAGSFAFNSGGLIRHVGTASAAKDHLMFAISGANNGFQVTQDSSNNIAYKFHTVGNVETLKVDGEGVKVNDASSSALDFRVETDANNSAFLVDASTEFISMGVPLVLGDLIASGSGGLSLQTSDGTKRVIIDDSTGQVQVSPGSATVPGLAFIGDTNTGINADNADNLGFTVGGTQRAFLSSTQFNVNANGVFSGSISKGSGSFKIDHPLPAKTDTHHLVHSFVEAPQADNIYRGSVDLVGGSATINIDTAAGMTDGTFVLLNTNVQCFTSNESGWTAIKGSVSGNTLTITAQDNSCTDTISWMVVGERHDQHMKDTEWTDSDGKVIVEPEKT